MSGYGSSRGKLKDNNLTDDVGSREATSSRASPSPSPRTLDPRIDASKKSTSSVSALRELVSIRNGMHMSYDFHEGGCEVWPFI